MRLIYLHGFASGPESSKGQFLRERFARAELALELPDLTQGDFERTTLTLQLAFLHSLIDARPAVLLGSSMGGYLGALFAARHPERVTALVLLAPAFDLARRWGDSLGEPVMRDWEREGGRVIYHYGEKRERRISYDLIRDALHYEPFPDVRSHTLVIHGRRDETVDYRLSEQFARDRPNVELVLLDSDHQLLDVVETVWDKVWAFLSRPPHRGT